MTIERVHQHINSKKEKDLALLGEFVSHPSISAQNHGVKECADFLKEVLESCGITSKLMETDGQPIVYGECLSGNPQAPTILFYGHYDVQPPEPLELWDTPPFEPVIRNDHLWGRGTGDNKGQLLTHILAVRSYLETCGEVPVNVTFVFEGEEEIGSPYMADFVKAHTNLLAADIVYISDGPLYKNDLPLINFGNRGVLSLEIHVTTAATDNHSGNKGGVIPNASWELVRLLNTMTDHLGNVTIEGFHDDVPPVSETERRLMEALPYDPDSIADTFGVDRMVLPKMDFYERLMLQPTMTINGLISGYSGEGSKTVIPAKASAKIDMRLVGNQRPDDIFQKVQRHVMQHCPYAKAVNGHSMLPSKTDPDLPLCRKVIKAVADATGHQPILMPAAGGSLPNYVWTSILNTPAVSVPYANVDENNHAPNENIKISLFHRGIHTSAQVLHELSIIQ